MRRYDVEILGTAEEIFEGDDPISLITGNGFTMAYPVIGQDFNYPNLLSSAQLHPNIQSVFTSFQTTNFEEVLKAYDDCLRLLTIYHPNLAPAGNILATIQADAQTIETDFIDAITRIHPPASTSLTAPHTANCADFLRRFSRIYTTNYDLFLYWIVNSQRLVGSFTDGFNRTGVNQLHWDPEVYGQNLHFLHGGLHLYSDRHGEIRKIVSNTAPIVAQIVQNISLKHYPLVVLEGSSADKKQSIRRNAYLNYSFGTLRTMEGKLVVYGMSFQFDTHLLERILQSNLTTIYFSLYGTPQEQQHTAHQILVTINNVNRNSGKTFRFVDCAAFTVW